MKSVSPIKVFRGTDPGQFEIFISLLPERVIRNLWLIPIVEGGKLPEVPAGTSWKSPKYRLTPEQALERLEAGRNVGVVGTKDTLAVLDIERENVLEADKHFPPSLKDTLVVRTRNGGLHLYYLNAGVPNRDLIVDGRRLVEVRADWRYVLAPGSYVPPDGEGDGLYRVVNAKPPLTLSPALLPWTAEEERPVAGAPVKFGGAHLSLPCVAKLLEVPLADGRKYHGAKLVGIAWHSDGGTEELLRELARLYDRVQPGRGRWVLNWGRWAARRGIRWDHCGEAVNLYRANGMLPPCGLCPLRRGEDARVRP
jgi:hypothetical protein